MLSALLVTSLAALGYLPTATRATCHDPAPVFPPPEYRLNDRILLDAFANVQASLDELISSPQYSTSSFSIQVTSSNTTLWSSYHTAREKNSSRPGAEHVQGDSAFRIASITKTFTTLAVLQLHEAGRLSLDDPVTKYLPRLTGPLPWNKITLRILASQLSGIPRDWSQGDLVTELKESWRSGLPPPRPNNADLPDCYAFSDVFEPCDADDLYRGVSHLQPVFAPNIRSTYSNIAFEVLGLVVANASGLEYEEYVQRHILDLIGMKDTTFKAPPDSVAVRPTQMGWFFDVDQGIHRPTGGLYSSADDLSKYLRYILAHANTVATGINWLQPHSFMLDSSHGWYGMPWEIFRATKLLQGGGGRARPVTFYTKAGGVPGYLSHISVVPDFGLGFAILVASGGPEISALIETLRERVTVSVVRAAAAVAAAQTRARYAGRFVFERSLDSTTAADKLNSSLTLTWDTAQHALTIAELVSNGTDVLAVPGLFSLEDTSSRAPPASARLRLLPTLLYADAAARRGEVWRALPVSEPAADDEAVWGDFCITDVGSQMYDGDPLNELVLWTGDDGRLDRVDLTAFRVALRRELAEAEKTEADTLLTLQ